GARCEGLHGGLVVGGDEHQVSAAPDATRGLDAGESRHVHIEKTDVGAKSLALPDSLAAIASLCDHLQLGPGPLQLARESLAQQRFVVGDQGGRARGHQSAVACAGNSSSAHAPCGLTALRRSCASPPKASCRRSRSVVSPLPCPPAAGLSPTPVSLTRTRHLPSRRCAWTSMRPPSSLGSTPC